MEVSDQELKRRLTPEQYHVLREKGTEAPFTGDLLYNDAEGTYACQVCGNILFDSETKFEAHCGWPSFNKAKEGSVLLTPDYAHGMSRTEVTCAVCGSHLGHVFDDAPDQPTGQRFCINSVSLSFQGK